MCVQFMACRNTRARRERESREEHWVSCWIRATGGEPQAGERAALPLAASFYPTVHLIHHVRELSRVMRRGCHSPRIVFGADSNAVGVSSTLDLPRAEPTFEHTTFGGCRACVSSLTTIFWLQIQAAVCRLQSRQRDRAIINTSYDQRRSVISDGNDVVMHRTDAHVSGA